ncbi:MAG: 50S ribosomal protein L11 methyltransferase [Firmicutes bacterium]|nr:50S ribosomal protein L11 methyltransferase [Bacillota bacterium]
MEWLELSADAPPELAESVADVFASVGASGAVFTGPAITRQAAENRGEAGVIFPDVLSSEGPVKVCAYLPLCGEAEDKLSRVRRRLLEPPFNARVQLGVSTVQSEDWARAWKHHYRVERAGSRIVVVPSWIDYQPSAGEVIIRLDPGEAFGTGQHETTRTCLQALEEFVFPGCRVLDVGTGSGVLAIAAAKLGAGFVKAVDIDPVAVEVARANVERNGVDGSVHVAGGNLASGVVGRFDVVVANILAEVVCVLSQDVPALLAPGGAFISSGYVKASVPQVVGALESAGHEVVRRVQEGDWVTLISRSRGGPAAGA